MSALAAIAMQAGFPLIQKILSGKLGDANGKLAADVIGAIATRAGVAPEALEAANVERPGSVVDAMRVVEASVVPEKLALFMKEAELALTLAQAEQEGPAWKSAWRPAGMYLIGFLWVWHTVLVHIANAFWKIALPPMPLDVLATISASYIAVYMGGHTVKEVFGKGAAK